MHPSIYPFIWHVLNPYFVLGTSRYLAPRDERHLLRGLVSPWRKAACIQTAKRDGTFLWKYCQSPTLPLEALERRRLWSGILGWYRRYKMESLGAEQTWEKSSKLKDQHGQNQHKGHGLLEGKKLPSEYMTEINTGGRRSTDDEEEREARVRIWRALEGTSGSLGFIL